MFEKFLSSSDSERASRAFQKLARHDIGRWALTGGFAVELYSLRAGRKPAVRSFNDIDFITDSFDWIPDSLADDFLFRHIHPFDLPGKTLLQMIETDASVRIDLFRSLPGPMNRATVLESPFGKVKLISLEDLIARTARLALDLAANVPVPSKHATDFLWLAKLADPAQVETVWQDHRKPAHPATFAEASRLLHDLIPARKDLLIDLIFSKTPGIVCTRCAPTARLPLADQNVVLSVLGYC